MINWLSFSVSIPYPTLSALAFWASTGLLIHVIDVVLRAIIPGMTQRKPVPFLILIIAACIFGPVIAFTRTGAALYRYGQRKGWS